MADLLNLFYCHVSLFNYYSTKHLQVQERCKRYKNDTKCTECVKSEPGKDKAVIYIPMQGQSP